VDVAALRFRLVSGEATCAFQLASDVPLTSSIRESSADHRGDKLGLKQLVASATTPQLRIVSVYAPWGGEASVTLEATTPSSATVRVQRGNDTDVWAWKAAEDGQKPSALTLDAGTRRTFELTSADTAPNPEGEPQW
jgi:hypothetical protein